MRHREGLQFLLNGRFQTFSATAASLAQGLGCPAIFLTDDGKTFFQLIFFIFRQTYAVHFASYFFEVP